MPGCSFSIGIMVSRQRMTAILVRIIRSVHLIAILTILVLTVALIGGCKSVEQPTLEQPPVEALEEIPGRIPLESLCVPPAGT
jgi:hypothetical protein